ncbi:hypothetical protein OIDMADRAFT_56933 [Oidiodendron maius Zn]|uniref:DRBM domain-containing protein n=1 Tax=Oidiodendron maius (strain Zn) TaxID=913774 RepID=A0A0C3CHX0_OIDMZ|nr:hypothetical protein OIDMADRAFT_56933 [Oidiodendron maius Zn]
MGSFPLTFKRLKESCLKITSSNIRSKSSAIQQAADTSLSSEFKTSSAVPVDEILELPTNDPKNPLNKVFELPANTMLPEESTAKVICEGSPSPKDRWLGAKLLEITISIVASRSISAHASEDEIEKLCQEMKKDFPFEQCFKELDVGRGTELEGSNYPRLLESLLGQICLQGKSDFSDIFSKLGRNIDPWPNRNQKYLVQPLQPHPDHATQEVAILGSTSQDTTTEEGSTSDANHPTRSTSQRLVSETPPTEVDEKFERLLRNLDEVRELPRYKSVFYEYGNLTGFRPSYVYNERQLGFKTMYYCTATFRGVEVVGLECGNKKDAGHMASKALAEKLLAGSQCRA